MNEEYMSAQKSEELRQNKLIEHVNQQQAIEAEEEAARYSTSNSAKSAESTIEKSGTNIDRITIDTLTKIKNNTQDAREKAWLTKEQGEETLALKHSQAVDTVYQNASQSAEAYALQHNFNADKAYANQLQKSLKGEEDMDVSDNLQEAYNANAELDFMLTQKIPTATSHGLQKADLAYQHGLDTNQLNYKHTLGQIELARRQALSHQYEAYDAANKSIEELRKFNQDLFSATHRFAQTQYMNGFNAAYMASAKDYFDINARISQDISDLAIDGVVKGTIGLVDKIINGIAGLASGFKGTEPNWFEYWMKKHGYGNTVSIHDIEAANDIDIWDRLDAGLIVETLATSAPEMLFMAFLGGKVVGAASKAAQIARNATITRGLGTTESALQAIYLSKYQRVIQRLTALNASNPGKHAQMLEKAMTRYNALRAGDLRFIPAHLVRAAGSAAGFSGKMAGIGAGLSSYGLGWGGIATGAILLDVMGRVNEMAASRGEGSSWKLADIATAFGHAIVDYGGSMTALGKLFGTPRMQQLLGKIEKAEEFMDNSWKYFREGKKMKALGSLALDKGISVATEGIGEGLQTYLEAYAESNYTIPAPWEIMLGDDPKYAGLRKNIVESAVLGGITGGVMDLVSTPFAALTNLGNKGKTARGDDFDGADTSNGSLSQGATGGDGSSADTRITSSIAEDLERESTNNLNTHREKLEKLQKGTTEYNATESEIQKAKADETRYKTKKEELKKAEEEIYNLDEKFGVNKEGKFKDKTGKTTTHKLSLENKKAKIQAAKKNANRELEKENKKATPDQTTVASLKDDINTLNKAEENVDLLIAQHEALSYDRMVQEEIQQFKSSNEYRNAKDKTTIDAALDQAVDKMRAAKTAEEVSKAVQNLAKITGNAELYNYIQKKKQEGNEPSVKIRENQIGDANDAKINQGNQDGSNNAKEKTSHDSPAPQPVAPTNTANNQQTNQPQQQPQQTNAAQQSSPSSNKSTAQTSKEAAESDIETIRESLSKESGHALLWAMANYRQQKMRHDENTPIDKHVQAYQKGRTFLAIPTNLADEKLGNVRKSKGSKDGEIIQTDEYELVVLNNQFLVSENSDEVVFLSTTEDSAGMDAVNPIKQALETMVNAKSNAFEATYKRLNEALKEEVINTREIETLAKALQDAYRNSVTQINSSAQYLSYLINVLPENSDIAKKFQSIYQGMEYTLKRQKRDLEALNEKLGFDTITSITVVEQALDKDFDSIITAIKSTSDGLFEGVRELIEKYEQAKNQQDRKRHKKQLKTAISGLYMIAKQVNNYLMTDDMIAIYEETIKCLSNPTAVYALANDMYYMEFPIKAEIESKSSKSGESIPRRSFKLNPKLKFMRLDFRDMLTDMFGRTYGSDVKGRLINGLLDGLFNSEGKISNETLDTLEPMRPIFDEIQLYWNTEQKTFASYSKGILSDSTTNIYKKVTLSDIIFLNDRDIAIEILGNQDLDINDFQKNLPDIRAEVINKIKEPTFGFNQRLKEFLDHNNQSDFIAKLDAMLDVALIMQSQYILASTANGNNVIESKMNPVQNAWVKTFFADGERYTNSEIQSAINIFTMLANTYMKSLEYRYSKDSYVPVTEVNPIINEITKKRDSGIKVDKKFSRDLRLRYNRQMQNWFKIMGSKTVVSNNIQEIIATIARSSLPINERLQYITSLMQKGRKFTDKTLGSLKKQFGDHFTLNILTDALEDPKNILTADEYNTKKANFINNKDIAERQKELEDPKNVFLNYLRIPYYEVKKIEYKNKNGKATYVQYIKVPSFKYVYIEKLGIKYSKGNLTATDIKFVDKWFSNVKKDYKGLADLNSKLFASEKTSVDAITKKTDETNSLLDKIESGNAELGWLLYALTNRELNKNKHQPGTGSVQKTANNEFILNDNIDYSKDVFYSYQVQPDGRVSAESSDFAGNKLGRITEVVVPERFYTIKDLQQIKQSGKWKAPHQSPNKVSSINISVKLAGKTTAFDVPLRQMNSNDNPAHTENGVFQHTFRDANGKVLTYPNGAPKVGYFAAPTYSDLQKAGFTDDQINELYRTSPIFYRARNGQLMGIARIFGLDVEKFKGEDVGEKHKKYSYIAKYSVKDGTKNPDGTPHMVKVERNLSNLYLRLISSEQSDRATASAELRQYIQEFQESPEFKNDLTLRNDNLALSYLNAEIFSAIDKKQPNATYNMVGIGSKPFRIYFDGAATLYFQNTIRFLDTQLGKILTGTNTNRVSGAELYESAHEAKERLSKKIEDYIQAYKNSGVFPEGVADNLLEIMKNKGIDAHTLPLICWAITNAPFKDVSFIISTYLNSKSLLTRDTSKFVNTPLGYNSDITDQIKSFEENLMQELQPTVSYALHLFKNSEIKITAKSINDMTEGKAKSLSVSEAIIELHKSDTEYSKEELRRLLTEALMKYLSEYSENTSKMIKAYKSNDVASMDYLSTKYKIQQPSDNDISSLDNKVQIINSFLRWYSSGSKRREELTNKLFDTSANQIWSEIKEENGTVDGNSPANPNIAEMSKFFDELWASENNDIKKYSSVFGSPVRPNKRTVSIAGNISSITSFISVNLNREAVNVANAAVDIITQEVNGRREKNDILYHAFRTCLPSASEFNNATITFDTQLGIYTINFPSTSNWGTIYLRPDDNNSFKFVDKNGSELNGFPPSINEKLLAGNETEESLIKKNFGSINVDAFKNDHNLYANMLGQVMQFREVTNGVDLRECMVPLGLQSNPLLSLPREAADTVKRVAPTVQTETLLEIAQICRNIQADLMDKYNIPIEEANNNIKFKEELTYLTNKATEAYVKNIAERAWKSRGGYVSIWSGSPDAEIRQTTYDLVKTLQNNFVPELINGLLRTKVSVDGKSSISALIRKAEIMLPKTGGLFNQPFEAFTVSLVMAAHNQTFDAIDINGSAAVDGIVGWNNENNTFSKEWDTANILYQYLKAAKEARKQSLQEILDNHNLSGTKAYSEKESLIENIINDSKDINSENNKHEKDLVLEHLKSLNDIYAHLQSISSRSKMGSSGNVLFANTNGAPDGVSIAKSRKTDFETTSDEVLSEYLKILGMLHNKNPGAFSDIKKSLERNIVSTNNTGDVKLNIAKIMMDNNSIEFNKLYADEAYRKDIIEQINKKANGYRDKFKDNAEKNNPINWLFDGDTRNSPMTTENANNDSIVEIIKSKIRNTINAFYGKDVDILSIDPDKYNIVDIKQNDLLYYRKRFAQSDGGTASNSAITFYENVLQKKLKDGIIANAFSSNGIANIDIDVINDKIRDNIGDRTAVGPLSPVDIVDIARSTIIQEIIRIKAKGLVAQNTQSNTQLSDINNFNTVVDNISIATIKQGLRESRKEKQTSVWEYATDELSYTHEKEITDENGKTERKTIKETIKLSDKMIINMSELINNQHENFFSDIINYVLNNLEQQDTTAINNQIAINRFNGKPIIFIAMTDNRNSLDPLTFVKGERNGKELYLNAMNKLSIAKVNDKTNDINAGSVSLDANPEIKIENLKTADDVTIPPSAIDEMMSSNIRREADADIETETSEETTATTPEAAQDSNADTVVTTESTGTTFVNVGQDTINDVTEGESINNGISPSNNTEVNMEDAVNTIKKAAQQMAEERARQGITENNDTTTRGDAPSNLYNDSKGPNRDININCMTKTEVSQALGDAIYGALISTETTSIRIKHPMTHVDGDYQLTLTFKVNDKAELEISAYSPFFEKPQTMKIPLSEYLKNSQAFSKSTFKFCGNMMRQAMISRPAENMDNYSTTDDLINTILYSDYNEIYIKNSKTGRMMHAYLKPEEGTVTIRCYEVDVNGNETRVSDETHQLEMLESKEDYSIVLTPESKQQLSEHMSEGVSFMRGDINTNDLSSTVARTEKGNSPKRSNRSTVGNEEQTLDKFKNDMIDDIDTMTNDAANADIVEELGSLKTFVSQVFGYMKTGIRVFYNKYNSGRSTYTTHKNSAEPDIITINKAGLEGTTSRLHEFIHAVTEHGAQYPSNKAKILVARLRDIQKIVKDGLDMSKITDPAERIVMQKIWNDLGIDQAWFDYMFNDNADNRGDANSLAEFIATFFSDPRKIKYLSQLNIEVQFPSLDGKKGWNKKLGMVSAGFEYAGKLAAATLRKKDRGESAFVLMRNILTDLAQYNNEVGRSEVRAKEDGKPINKLNKRITDTVKHALGRIPIEEYAQQEGIADGFKEMEKLMDKYFNESATIQALERYGRMIRHIENPTIRFTSMAVWLLSTFIIKSPHFFNRNPIQREALSEVISDLRERVLEGSFFDTLLKLDFGIAPNRFLEQQANLINRAASFRNHYDYQINMAQREIEEFVMNTISENNPEIAKLLSNEKTKKEYLGALNRVIGHLNIGDYFYGSQYTIREAQDLVNYIVRGHEETVLNECRNNANRFKELAFKQLQEDATESNIQFGEKQRNSLSKTIIDLAYARVSDNLNEYGISNIELALRHCGFTNVSKDAISNLHKAITLESIVLPFRDKGNTTDPNLNYFKKKTEILRDLFHNPNSATKARNEAIERSLQNLISLHAQKVNQAYTNRTLQMKKNQKFIEAGIGRDSKVLDELYYAETDHLYTETGVLGKSIISKETDKIDVTDVAYLDSKKFYKYNSSRDIKVIDPDNPPLPKDIQELVDRKKKKLTQAEKEKYTAWAKSKYEDLGYKLMSLNGKEGDNGKYRTDSGVEVWVYDSKFVDQKAHREERVFSSAPTSHKGRINYLLDEYEYDSMKQEMDEKYKNEMRDVMSKYGNDYTDNYMPSYKDQNFGGSLNTVGGSSTVIRMGKLSNEEFERITDVDDSVVTMFSEMEAQIQKNNHRNKLNNQIFYQILQADKEIRNKRSKSIGKENYVGCYHHTEILFKRDGDEFIFNEELREKYGVNLTHQDVKEFAHLYSQLSDSEKTINPNGVIYVDSRLIPIIFGRDKLDIGRSLEDTNPYLFRAAKALQSGWRAVMKDMKNTIILRNPKLIYVNAMGNFYGLVGEGIPITDAAESWAYYANSLNEYNSDESRARKIRHNLTILRNLSPQDGGKIYIPIENKLLVDVDAETKANIIKQYELELNRLDEKLVNNPVHPLVKAGFYSNLVEDSETEGLDLMDTGIEKFIEWTNVEKRNPKLAYAIREVGLKRDSDTYNTAAHLTRMGDFIPRVVLYYHLRDKGLEHTQALDEARNRFINYNTPIWSDNLSKLEQMGAVMFSKYRFAVQYQILQAFKNAPIQASAMLGVELMLEASGLKHNPVTSYLGEFGDGIPNGLWNLGTEVLSNANRWKFVEQFSDDITDPLIGLVS